MPTGDVGEVWGGRKAQEYVAGTLERYGTICRLCGLPGADSADHIIARSHGGAVYDYANLRPAHQRCNESRGNRDLTAPVESGLGFFVSG
ncbi:HNH endonuclease [Plantibacter sp. RU18]|uniref:HNH endonuclease n=1 Tax=Plantibacter sp. RU18 TaxID=3158143 RepID=UPI003D3622C9